MTAAPYKFGAASLARLSTVQPALSRVCVLALSRSAIDFGITEGVRSDADQLRDWIRGNSRFNGVAKGVVTNGVVGTGRGKHQAGPDGLGRAVDAWGYINGQIVIQMPSTAQWLACCQVAEAMRSAAEELGVVLIWGAVWDKPLNRLPPGADALAAARDAYAARHNGADLLDGPHFELA